MSFLDIYRKSLLGRGNSKGKGGLASRAEDKIRGQGCERWEVGVGCVGLD